MRSFRLIQSGPCDAATNMSIDEALFLSYREGISAPALRLYGWRPHAFSVGYSQDPRELLDLEACRKDNIDVVRRPTGGGTLFHGEELTYSVVLAPADFGIARRDVKESYYRITSFLVEVLRSLGLKARFSRDLADPAAPGSVADFCLSRKEPYDILLEGKKIGGHAQKRRKNLILQHGTLPLSIDTGMARYFLKGQDACLDAIALKEARREKTTLAALSAALIESFASLLHRRPKTEELNTAERHLAENLKVSKYADDGWNLRRQKNRGPDEPAPQAQMA